MRGPNGKQAARNLPAAQNDHRTSDTYDETYVNDWEPTEIEIFLL
jgi:hypothetical protein